MFAIIHAFLIDESGVSGIEFAFVAGLVSIASVVAWGALGDSVTAAFASVSSDVGTVASGMTPGSPDLVKLSADVQTLDGTTR
jgi:Flp pilus assembly pilin Flp